MPEPTLNLLERVINYSSLRGKVINKNIANVNTEFYQREEVDFGQALNEAFNKPFKVTKEKHIPLEPDKNDFKVVKDKRMEDNSGVNNVLIDQEMADLAENTILFKFAARKISKYFQNMQDIIRGGRR